MTVSLSRRAMLRGAAGIGIALPWLEAMSIRGLTYGPKELRLQIQGVYDAGLKSWALWNPGSRYGEFLAALRPQSGGPSRFERSGDWTPPKWTLPRERLSKLIVRRDRAARDSARAATAPADTTRP